MRAKAKVRASEAWKPFPWEKFDQYGRLVGMTRSGGYVMARRPGKAPFIISEKEWKRLADSEDNDCQLRAL